MARASPESSLIFLFPIRKASVIKTVPQVLPWSSKVPRDHFGGFHPPLMRERLEECLAWSSLPAYMSRHCWARRPSSLQGKWRVSLFLNTAVFCPLATVNGGLWGIYSLTLITGCVGIGCVYVCLSLVPSSSRSYKQCFLVLNSMHKYFHSLHRAQEF